MDMNYRGGMREGGGGQDGVELGGGWDNCNSIINKYIKKKLSKKKSGLNDILQVPRNMSSKFYKGITK